MLSFIRAEARWLAAGILLTFFSGFGQTYFISLSNKALMAQFDLTHGGIALVYSAATLASAAILLEFGKIVDRVSTRSATMIVIVGLAGACLLVASAAAVWMLFAAFVGLRLFGQGMMSHVAMTAAGRWYAANRGRAVSLVALGHPASEALFPPLGVMILFGFGLGALWGLGAAILIVLAAPLLFVLLLRERTPRTPSGQDAGERDRAVAKCSWRRSDVLREPSFWASLVGVTCPAFMVTGLFFHQLHLIELKAWQPGLFAAGFSAFAAMQVVSSLLAGMLVDRFSARALLPVYLVPLAAALMLPLLADASWTIFAMMILLGLTGGFAATIMGALWPELFGVQFLGEIRAMTFSAMVASTAASPLLTGWLIDQGVDFTRQLFAMGVYALLASALMGLIQPRLSAVSHDTVAPGAATS